MSHMVIFRSSEGKAGYHQAETLDDAIRFVERLRNQEGVDQARIFRMEEVGFEFRPYFRVEVGAAGAMSGPPPVADAPPPDAPPADAGPTGEPSTEEGDEPAPEPVEVSVGAEPVNDTNGRRGLFGR